MPINFHNPVHRHYLIIGMFLAGTVFNIWLFDGNIIPILIWLGICVVSMFLSGKCPHCGENIPNVRWFASPKVHFPTHCDNCGEGYDNKP